MREVAGSAALKRFIEEIGNVADQVTQIFPFLFPAGGLADGNSGQNPHKSNYQGGTMDAIKLLENDHREVEKILDKLETTTERGVKTREELFAKLKEELTIHETIEEEIFYPALKEHPKAKDIVLEGYEEHHVVDTIMSEISLTPFDDETWGAKFSVMKENLAHHIEEEEGEMFKTAREVFAKDELTELGSLMEARKEKINA